jgi:hypothetical protein
MIGLNIMYSMMIALIPDQVPKEQTGVANGILALEFVLGSLVGFGLFHSVLGASIQNMYGLYTCIVILSTIVTGTYAHDRDAELTLLRIERRRMLSQEQDVASVSNGRIDSSQMEILQSRSCSPKWRRRMKGVAKRSLKHAKTIAVTPTLILNSLLVTPFQSMNWKRLYQSYTIDTQKHHDFFIVTVSRLFYYCGMSVQTFFLYFIKDIIKVKTNPEAAVASLAILGQCSAALTCYPVGFISDKMLNGRRKPFVYFSCMVLCVATITLIFAETLSHVAVFCFILGAANGIYLTTDTSLAVDTLPGSESLEGDGSGSAQLLGIWGIAAFLGSALGPLLGGPLLYYVGSNASTKLSNNDEDGGFATGEGYSISGYAVVLSLSSVYFILSAATLMFLRKAK